MDYDDARANARWQIKDEPSSELILKEINGVQRTVDGSLKSSQPLRSFDQLKDDGSTA